MGVTTKGKWIIVSPTDMPVAEAAEHSLRLRLHTTVETLPRAAEHAQEDTEHVHRLRVACRRATACVEAYRPLTSHGTKRLRKWLTRIRQAAGPARDLDVLLGRIVGKSDPRDEQLIERLQEKRRAVQLSLIDAEEHTKRKKFHRTVDRCLQGIRANKENVARRPFEAYAITQLRRQIDRYLEDCRTGEFSVEQLHAMRISGKQLRYSIELFRSALPKRWRKNAYRRIVELQERLGRINDHAAAQVYFQRLLGDMPADAHSAYVAEQVVAEHRSLTAERAEFLDWWTDERRRDFVSLLRDAKSVSQSTNIVIETPLFDAQNGASNQDHSVASSLPTTDSTDA